MSDINLDRVQAQMARLRDLASNGRSAELIDPSQATSFADTLGAAIENVREQQHLKREAINAFERGEEIDLVDVMLINQRASLYMEATKQVRNQLVKSYQDILSMPI